MTDQKNSKQVVRDLKWFDMKGPDPSIIYVWELRVRNVNEELHTPSIRQLPQVKCVPDTVQTVR